MKLPLIATLLFFATLASFNVEAQYLDDGYAHDEKGRVLLGPDQWGLAAIGLDARQLKTLAMNKRASVVVAVIDTGLDYEHPDIANDNIWRNAAEKPNGIDDDKNGYVDDLTGWDFVDNDNDPWDDVGHGTHVAGIIAATTGNGEGIAGVDGKAIVMPLRALNTIGRGYSSGIARAITYATDNGAAIINLSMAVRDVSVHEKQAIAYALARGVVVVAASGNEGQDTSAYTPAVHPGVITVAATDRDNQRAGFSNWGREVDISAPGVEILSLRAVHTDFNVLLGDDTAVPGQGIRGPAENYYAASGTSFAAPYVSGAAALLLSTRPALSAGQVRRLLLHSARDIATPGRDQNTGYGLLDISAALAAEPDFYITCDIAGVEVANAGSGTVLRVIGTADADAFAGASLTLAAGKPAQQFGSEAVRVDTPVTSGTLADLPVMKLQGAKEWTLRLTVQHKNSAVRECRYQVSLG